MRSRAGTETGAHSDQGERAGAVRLENGLEIWQPLFHATHDRVIHLC